MGIRSVLFSLLLGCAPDKASNPGKDQPDADMDGWAADQDCDDGSSAIHPEADELCDSLDNDCDGEVDEDPADETAYYPDLDEDGFGDAAAGERSCTVVEGAITTGEDCDDSNAAVYPGAAEICDGLDDDCDGLTDESSDNTALSYADTDADGYGDAEAPGPGCAIGQGGAAISGDCDDGNASIHPDASQACGTVDTDCDPNTEGDTGVSVTEADGSITDMTEAFAAGTLDAPVALDLDGGDWRICEGTWYARLTLSGTISLTGAAPLTTALNGGSRGSVLTVTATGAVVSVRDLTLTEGLGSGVRTDDLTGGGGLSCAGDAEVALTDVFLIGNSAELGGGIYVHGCSLTLNDLTFLNNRAEYGAGIFADVGTVDLVDSELLGNVAEYTGGAITGEADDGPVAISLTNTLVHSNRATYGGGVALLYDTEVTCTGSGEVEAGIQSNYADYGGGVYISPRDGLARFTANACDFGGEDELNDPNDVEIRYTATYDGFGEDASFTCDEEACG